MELKDNHYPCSHWLKQNNDKNEQTVIIKDVDDLIFADENVKTHSER